MKIDRSKALILVSIVAVAVIFGSTMLTASASGNEEGEGHLGRRGLPPPWLNDLTEEHRDAIRQKVQEMRAAGASREQIKAEITTMLQGFGVEVPERQFPSQPNMQEMRQRIRQRMHPITCTEN